MVLGRMIGSARASGRLYFFEDGTKQVADSISLKMELTLENIVEIPKIVLDDLQVPERKEAILKEMRDVEKNETREVDHNTFTRHSADGKKAILIVHVDDIILTGDDITEIEWLKQCLPSEFEIEALGSLIFFLGMEIARSKKGYAVSQMEYVIDLLKETEANYANLAATRNVVEPSKMIAVMPLFSMATTNTFSSPRA
ncbi:hypothetical protein RJ639_040487 [Escallonia herrerae]|uniref:Reverse transcriptase Ty1/copia-type domain-containing protein n=1 Tax=Escallonia herrerae TaxID=1293975 RepID=A0AA88WII4_9ASTE|nr:hypothetical protein RJ639_040487 [Escallonia herrerae]